MEEKQIKIAWYGKHFGEEPPFVGDKTQGAGGIFFTGCNLKCVFCQNYQISHEDFGKEYSIEELAKIMLDLQNQGCINIDLVTPTIWWREIKSAIPLAKDLGLKIPIVWNSNGYENTEIIRQMNGLVDIYLPDFKYSNDDLAVKYSNGANYVEIAKNALSEMLFQCGNLIIENDIAKCGVLVRHMILPNNIENTLGVIDILSSIDKNLYVSLMSQYSPLYGASNFPEINRTISEEEYEKVFDYLLDKGMENGWVQDLESKSLFIPDFRKEKPFE